jgi:WD40 repeat protein
LRGHKYTIDHVVFSPDSKYLVSVCNKDGGMFVWDCKTGERLTQNKNSKNINSIKFLNPNLL